MNSRSRLAVLCCWFLLSAPVLAVSPTEELLRYVPRDVSFCLVLRDLREHLQAFREGPFSQSLRKSPLGKALQASGEVQQLEKIEKFLEKMLGMSLDQVRDDVLGDAIVLAYRPGPPGKPEQEQGLVLIRARQAKPLSQLIDRLNKVLRESGALKETTEIEHEGLRYTRRVEADEVNYLHLNGPVLVFSGQEGILREALTLAKKAPAPEESPIGKSLRQLRADRSLGAFWINPRAFDGELAERLRKSTSADEKAFLETFVVCWKAIDAAAITLALPRDLEVGLSLQGRPEALPAPVRKLFEEAASPSDLWARVSEDSLLTLAARTPASSLLAFLGAFQTREAFEFTREELQRGLGAVLGKDIVKEVLPGVGPEWGLSISSPGQAEKAWFPSILFALKLAAGEGQARLDQAVLSMLDFYARASVISHNANRKRKDLLSLMTTQHEKVEIRYVASNSGKAMGLQPAFGLCDGYLVLGSSPETIKRFASRMPAKVQHAEVPLLRLSLVHLRTYLKDRRTVLSAALAEQHQLTPEQVSGQLDNLLTGLSLFDRLELSQRTGPGLVTFTFRVKAALPLRK